MAVDLRRRLELPNRRGYAPHERRDSLADGAVSLLVDKIGDWWKSTMTLSSAPRTLQGKVRELILGVHKLDKHYCTCWIRQRCETAPSLEAVAAK